MNYVRVDHDPNDLVFRVYDDEEQIHYREYIYDVLKRSSPFAVSDTDIIFADEAAKDAERYARRESVRLGCQWGTNYDPMEFM